MGAASAETSASDGAIASIQRAWVSVVYRVPDGLNDLNGLNCLNEQRLIAERLEVWMRVW
jgi:hypothetical protein